MLPTRPFWGAFIENEVKNMSVGLCNVVHPHDESAPYRGLAVLAPAPFCPGDTAETIAAWYQRLGFDTLVVDSDPLRLGRRARDLARTIYQVPVGVRKPPLVVLDDDDGVLVRARIAAKHGHLYVPPTHLLLGGNITERRLREAVAFDRQLAAKRSALDEFRRKLRLVLDQDAAQEAFEASPCDNPPLEGLFTSVTCLGLNTSQLRCDFTCEHDIFGGVRVASANPLLKGVDAVVAVRAEALFRLSIVA